MVRGAEDLAHPLDIHKIELHQAPTMGVRNREWAIHSGRVLMGSVETKSPGWRILGIMERMIMERTRRLGMIARIR